MDTVVKRGKDHNKKRVRTPKRLWAIVPMMADLARNVFAELRTTHSYKMKIARLEAERDERIDMFRQKRSEIIDTIFGLMNARRSDVEARGVKSLTLSLGDVGWRQRKPSVEVVGYENEDDAVKDLLTRKRGKKLLHPTWKLNKSLILEMFQKGIPLPKWLRVKTGEEFFISLAPRGQHKPKPIVRDM